jgi:hypothetical protein
LFAATICGFILLVAKGHEFISIIDQWHYLKHKHIPNIHFSYIF